MRTWRRVGDCLGLSPRPSRLHTCFLCAHAYTQAHSSRPAHISIVTRSHALTCAHAMQRLHTCANVGAHMHTHTRARAPLLLHARTRVVNVLYCVLLPLVVCHNAFFCLMTLASLFTAPSCKVKKRFFVCRLCNMAVVLFKEDWAAIREVC